MDIFNKEKVKELEKMLQLEENMHKLSKERIDKDSKIIDELRNTIAEYQQKEQKQQSTHSKRENLVFAFEVDGRNFYRHLDPTQLNVIRYEQYQVSLMELDSGLGTDSWKELVKMLSRASQPDDKNRIDLKAINYVATEMEDRLNRVLVPSVMEDIFCLYMIEEDEDPYLYDEARHQDKKMLFRDNGYFQVSNEFFFGFLKSLESLGRMSEQEQREYIEKNYLAEVYRDLKMKRIINTYLQNEK